MQGGQRSGLPGARRLCSLTQPRPGMADQLPKSQVPSPSGPLFPPPVDQSNPRPVNGRHPRTDTDANKTFARLHQSTLRFDDRTDPYSYYKFRGPSTAAPASQMNTLQGCPFCSVFTNLQYSIFDHRFQKQKQKCLTRTELI
jgi:hypothetical protein